MGFAKSDGLAQEPLINAYGNPEDGGIVHDDVLLMSDSSMFKPNKDVNPLLAEPLSTFYDIAAPPVPDNNDSGNKPVDKTWLQQNIVLVIVVGVVGFMVLAALLYCLCCKANKQGYQNALYDEDSSMKARIQ